MNEHKAWNDAFDYSVQLVLTISCFGLSPSNNWLSMFLPVPRKQAKRRCCRTSLDRLDSFCSPIYCCFYQQHDNWPVDYGSETTSSLRPKSKEFFVFGMPPFLRTNDGTCGANESHILILYIFSYFSTTERHWVGFAWNWSLWWASLGWRMSYRGHTKTTSMAQSHNTRTFGWSLIW